MITIVDYGMGNLGSIKNMLKKIGEPSLITSDIDEIKKATKLILPGVGAFDFGMQRLHDLDLISVLNEKALNDKIPVLGICLGVQLMTKGSTEGERPGLGWFDANAVSFKGRFPEGKELPVPNMGWINVHPKKESKLLENLPPDPRFYFVHSYFLESNNPEEVLLEANYGFPYVAGFEKDNLVGVQFHPEKSHRYGMALLKNFVENY